MLEGRNPPGEIQAVVHWAGKIRLQGFVVKKTNSPDRKSNTMDHWTCSITLLGTSRRQDPKGGAKLYGFGGFAIDSLELHLFNYDDLTILIAKGSILKPPTEVPRWRSVCVAANSSHQNLGFENRGKRKCLPRCRFPKPPRELPKHPRFLAVGFKI
jgi:hypothetical protein